MNDIKNLIDEIHDLSIADQIGNYVSLKKKGLSYEGCCPFHDEKTPSFKVSPVKGIFKCFGCGKSGDLISFVMEKEKLDFMKAVFFLADKNSINYSQPQYTDQEKVEVKQKSDDRIEILNINEFALQYFKQQFLLSKDAINYMYSRINQCAPHWQFEIGYATNQWQGFYNHAKEHGYSFEVMEKAGLCKFGKNRKYDVFRNRLIFPIRNISGSVVGFGGRDLSGDDKSAKYLNSAENPVYNKSKILYGLFHAKEAIAKQEEVNLVEGYTDVIKLHWLDAANTIGTCGTALTVYHAKLIKRYTKTVNLILDGDPAGQRAAILIGELLLRQGLNVSITPLPPKHDPDTFFQNGIMTGLEVVMPNDYIKQHRQDFILYRASILLNGLDNDPQKRYEAVNELSRLINFKAEKTTKSMYIDTITETYKIGKQNFINEIKQAEVALLVRQDDDVIIPNGVDRGDWDKYGFYENKNSYYFKSREGKAKHTNFTLKPIFHIDSTNVNDSLRIYDLVNEDGFRIVLDFDMNEMNSINAFRRKLESRGNFLFWGTETHMAQLKMKLYKETTTCTEIKNLGWQKEGFWAWSNGISTENGFIPVDDYGRVDFEIQNFYIPAFSRIYIKDRSVFLDERKFRFMENEITIPQWASKMVDVFGDNAKIGIAFYIAAIFRDHMLHLFKNFPLLNLFGPKGTGKSQLAVSLACMFGIQQTPYNIHNGTKAGLAEHIQQFRNSLAWIDEYKNNIDYEKVETLKSIYDSIGRNRLNFDKGKKKETTQVNSAVILSGQEMPTVDVALFSRMIFCQFNQDQYNNEQKQSYDDLKSIEGKGLSHITANLIQYRKEFVKLYFNVYNETLADFASECEGSYIEDRLLRSMVMIVSAFRVMAESEFKIDFGFDYKELKRVGLKSIKDQQSQMKSSNEVSIFWQALEAMTATSELIDFWDYRIDLKQTLNLRAGKTKFIGVKNILSLRFNMVVSKFRKYAKTSGLNSLPAGTLEYYLKNSPYYLGESPGTKFKNTVRIVDEIKIERTTSTCMCFDYDLLAEMIGVNLIKDIEAKYSGIPEIEPDNRPF